MRQNSAPIARRQVAQSGSGARAQISRRQSRKAPVTAAAPRDVDRITEFDWDLVTFVVRWARYGGPDPEQVLPKFGMTCARLHERVGQIVEYTNRHPNRVTAAQRRLVARAEIWLSSLDSGRPHGTRVGRTDLVEALGQPTLRRGIWRWQ